MNGVTLVRRTVSQMRSNARIRRRGHFEAIEESRLVSHSYILERLNVLFGP